MPDPVAVALSSTQAAIATPGPTPSVYILGFAQSVNVCGESALLMLRLAIDKALADAMKGADHE